MFIGNWEKISEQFQKVKCYSKKKSTKKLIFDFSKLFGISFSILEKVFNGLAKMNFLAIKKSKMAAMLLMSNFYLIKKKYFDNNQN